MRGGAPISELAGIYDLGLAEQDWDLSIADYMRRRLKRRPVEGDVVDIDSLRLTVRSLHAGIIETVGLQLREPEEAEGDHKSHKRRNRRH